MCAAETFSVCWCLYSIVYLSCNKVFDNKLAAAARQTKSVSHFQKKIVSKELFSTLCNALQKCIHNSYRHTHSGGCGYHQLQDCDQQSGKIKKNLSSLSNINVFIFSLSTLLFFKRHLNEFKKKDEQNFVKLIQILDYKI